jgi:hypothetical protein
MMRCLTLGIKKGVELDALGREPAKYGIEDKQTGSEKEHVWSGIAPKRI